MRSEGVFEISRSEWRNVTVDGDGVIFEGSLTAKRMSGDKGKRIRNKTSKSEALAGSDVVVNTGKNYNNKQQLIIVVAVHS